MKLSDYIYGFHGQALSAWYVVDEWKRASRRNVFNETFQTLKAEGKLRSFFDFKVVLFISHPWASNPTREDANLPDFGNHQIELVTKFLGSTFDYAQNGTKCVRLRYTNDPNCVLRNLSRLLERCLPHSSVMRMLSRNIGFTEETISELANANPVFVGNRRRIVDLIYTEALRHTSREQFLRQIGVWYDHCLLPQPPYQGTPAQKKHLQDIFDDSLSQLAGLMARTSVLLLPLGDYNKRPWCVMENDVANQYCVEYITLKSLGEPVAAADGLLTALRSLNEMSSRVRRHGGQRMVAYRVALEAELRNHWLCLISYGLVLSPIYMYCGWRVMLFTWVYQTLVCFLYGGLMPRFDILINVHMWCPTTVLLNWLSRRMQLSRHALTGLALTISLYPNILYNESSSVWIIIFYIVFLFVGAVYFVLSAMRDLCDRHYLHRTDHWRHVARLLLNNDCNDAYVTQFAVVDTMFSSNFRLKAILCLSAIDVALRSSHTWLTTGGLSIGCLVQSSANFVLLGITPAAPFGRIFDLAFFFRFLFLCSLGYIMVFTSVFLSWAVWPLNWVHIATNFVLGAVLCRLVYLIGEKIIDVSARQTCAVHFPDAPHTTFLTRTLDRVWPAYCCRYSDHYVCFECKTRIDERCVLLCRNGCKLVTYCSTSCRSAHRAHHHAHCSWHLDFMRKAQKEKQE